MDVEEGGSEEDKRDKMDGAEAEEAEAVKKAGARAGDL